MSVDHEVRQAAFLMAHVGMLHQTFAALDEKVRDDLLGVFREAIRKGDTEFFLKYTSVPDMRPIYRADVPASRRTFDRAFRKEVLRLIGDLRVPPRPASE